MPLEAAEHHYREDHTHPEDDRPKNVALNVGIKRPNQLADSDDPGQGFQFKAATIPIEGGQYWPVGMFMGSQRW